MDLKRLHEIKRIATISSRGNYHSQTEAIGMVNNCLELVKAVEDKDREILELKHKLNSHLLSTVA